MSNDFKPKTSDTAKEIESGAYKDNITRLDLNNSVDDIAAKLKNNIAWTPWVRTSETSSSKDMTPYENQYLIALLSYKGAELNKKATDRLSWVTLALVLATIGLVITTLAPWVLSWVRA